MTVSLTNLPPNQRANQELGAKEFINYFTNPLELNAGILDSIVGFFTSRGFEKTISQSLATVLISQAKRDNLNPLEFVDMLKNYNNTELNTLVIEIINYNRYKTSFLGFSKTTLPNNEISRNILL